MSKIPNVEVSPYPGERKGFLIDINNTDIFVHILDGRVFVNIWDGKVYRRHVVKTNESKGVDKEG